jgi:UDP-N-acetylmuramoyl-tripeptide--D-alanyl-D-alanine ligase
MKKKYESINWKFDAILEATEGVLISSKDENTYFGISIDTRTINKNEVFVAIKGENFDGHKFIGSAIEKGVKCIVINSDNIKDISDTNFSKYGTCIAVGDTTEALGKLGNFQRIRSKASVIAITGSNGKTTTKEMTKAVIEEGFNTLSTSGNFNNEIGVPLTLLGLSQTHEWAVVEMGMNHAGEIHNLAMTAKPDIGIITNVGPAHIEGLGSIKNILNAKAEIIDGIKRKGKLILNADDERVIKLKEFAETEHDLEVITFGKTKKADIRAQNIKINKRGMTFSVFFRDKEILMELPIFGRHMISNVLAACAAGYCAGMKPVKIRKGLEKFKPAEGRFNIIETDMGFNVINDTYNANPSSMEVAIATLKLVKKKKKGFAILADMLELGDSSETLHEEVGEVVADKGIDKLYVTGTYADSVIKGALRKKMDEKDIFKGTKEEIIENLKESVDRYDWLLVKGSRSMKMEDVTKAIINYGNSV